MDFKKQNMSTKLKILQINKFHYLKGGSERCFFDTIELLKQNGHEVVVFSMRDEKNLPSRYSEYFAAPVALDKFSFKNILKFFYNYEAAARLEKLIKKEKPDIAHLHNIAHQLSPAITYVLKKHKIPIVQTLHDYKLICPNYKLFSSGEVCYQCRGSKYYNCFLRRCVHNSYAKSFLTMLEAYLHNKILKSYDNAGIFIAPSKFMKNICVQFGIPEKKIAVVNNFIMDDFKLSDGWQRSDPNVLRRKNYLLYFGRLAHEKGVHVLIEAMALIADKDLILKIAGAGPEEKSLNSLIDKLNLHDRVELVGPKYGSKLKYLIKNASAVVIPSIWPENFPYSALEATALGKPVIASDIGGLPEIINTAVPLRRTAEERKNNDFLFKAGDASDLAKKIEEFLAAGMKENKLNENFSSIKHYNGLKKIYENILRSH